MIMRINFSQNGAQTGTVHAEGCSKVGCGYMKKLLFRHRESITYYGALAIGTLILAIIVSSVVRWAVAPQITANMKAYILIARADTSGRFSDKKQFADLAYSTADDPDIRKIADWLSRVYSLPLSLGVETPEEEYSLSGDIKIVLNAIKNPGTVIQAFGLEGEYMFCGLKTIANRVDDRYLPIFRSYRRAQEIGFVSFWLVLVGSACCYYKCRKQFRVWLLPMSQHLPFITATSTKTNYIGAMMFFGGLLTIVFSLFNCLLYSSRYAYTFLPPWTGFEVTVLVACIIGFILLRARSGSSHSNDNQRIP